MFARNAGKRYLQTGKIKIKTQFAIVAAVCMDNQKLQFMMEKQKANKIKSYQNHLNNLKNKKERTLDFGLYKLKQQCNIMKWSGSHKNCFRASVSYDFEAESEEHIDAKFKSWKEERRLGRAVFCEVELKDGSIPDQIIVCPSGYIFIKEFVNSEEEKSIERKKQHYPFEIQVIKIKNNGE